MSLILPYGHILWGPTCSIPPKSGNGERPRGAKKQRRRETSRKRGLWDPSPEGPCSFTQYTVCSISCARYGTRYLSYIPRPRKYVKKIAFWAIPRGFGPYFWGLGMCSYPQRVHVGPYDTIWPQSAFLMATL